MKKYILALILILGFLPLTTFAAFPNDPFAKQWAFEDIQIYEAWESGFIGSREVVVAIIDNGFDTHHPELLSNTWKNIDEIAGNGIDDDKNGYIDDVWGWSFLPIDINKDGEIDAEEQRGNNRVRPEVNSAAMDGNDPDIVHHGTVVAGLIGARGNNGFLGSGIMQRVSLMNVRVVDNSGSGVFEAIDDAIYYAVDNGADVINVSLVGTGMEKELEEAIDYAYEHGVVVVAAAGNDNMFLDETPQYPISSDKDSDIQKVLGVSAINEGHSITIFSNFGSSAVDLTAPGQGISSTLRYAPKNGLKDKYGDGWNGTSFAAPMVSATAGLIKSIQPSWRAKEIYEAILSTVHKTPPEDEETYAHLFGNGLLQIYDALVYAKEQIVASKPVNIFISVFEDGSISTFKKGGVQATHVGKVEDIVTAFFYQDNIYYVIREDDKLVIKTATGERTTSWEVPTDEVNVFVASVTGDSIPEIILTPKNSSMHIYWVYDLSGRLVKEKLQVIAKKGSHVELVYNAESQQHDIFTWETWNDKTIITVYGVDERTQNTYMLDIHARNVLIGDVDGDNKKEFVVMPKNGAWEDIVLFDDAGEKIGEKQMLSYFNGPRKTILADYNADGIDELIIAPFDAKELFVYTVEGKKVETIRGMSGELRLLTVF
ncbi:MAG: S8 family serine peptidase [Candidatus Magasanikbacteria bacterium]|nr:S8 family serine peptidase [Candidatus Magasanikbacteria bacterium]